MRPTKCPTKYSNKCPTLIRLCLISAVAGAAIAADVTSLTLINAVTDQPIAGYDPIPAGATLNLATLPTTQLNMRANVNGAVGSVRFVWSGAESGAQNETSAPYAMKSDSSGNYYPWTPAIGNYSLTATPYTGAGATGSVAGAAITRAFTVTSGSSSGQDGNGNVTISGELKRWHNVVLTLAGPWASESGTPNPFTDRRMDVTFSNGALTYVVPGYFAADGNAGESSATSGTTWRAHLSPDTTGTWTYTVSFRSGTDVAMNGGGATLAPYHGKTGSFTIIESDKTGVDFRAKGRLAYVGARYLRHRGNNEWFVKVGADSPENLLGYSDFDGTSDHDGGSLKSWSPHVGDWQSGDPTWKGGKGKGLIGALNYLANEGQNVVSFLTYNAGGDGKDVWPFTGHTDRLRYDCSKLDQWNAVFTHAQRRGLYLHFKTQETENDNGTWGLDGGDVGRERKLYYRELIARFSHHLALNWNLGEETTQTTAQQQAMAQFFAANDPYRHNVVLHTYPGQQEQMYRPLLGSASALTGASIQINWDAVHGETLQWINESTAAGKVWVVANDEQGSANIGIPPDAGWPGYSGAITQDQVRKATLWGNLMAGGAGVESYFGYQTGETDLSAQNFRSRDRWWDYCRYARAFFVQHLPFSEMVSRNNLVGNTANSNALYCFAKTGSVYAVYLPSGGTTNLDLSGVSGTFAVRWYDPRNGGSLQTGSVASITGGGQRSLGNAPNNSTQDWAVHITVSGGGGNVAPSVALTSPTAGQQFTAPGAIRIIANASDSDGAVSRVEFLAGGSLIATDNSAPYDWTWNNVAAGTYSITARAYDNAGASTTSAPVTVTVGAVSVPFTLTLINADSDQPMPGFDPLNSGATIALSSLPSPRLNLRANVSGVGSVKFTWSGPENGTATENVAPYAMKGDTNGNFNAWIPTPGTYTLTVTTHSASGAGGTLLQSRTLTFTVSDPAPATGGISASVMPPVK
ncbi:MAG: DUF5060 domain-containing protein [Planctomycetes bacterium]|nr:DUF5060 domain-containing protein [Planctomycetota bacterium]